MKAAAKRRGSVLVMALWIIAVLSIMVLSFAYEARQQAGIDVYVRERNRVSRLIDSGRMLGEAVLLGYADAPDPEVRNGVPDWKDAFEDDRWVIEKYALKTDHECTIGPICLEDRDEDDETDPVTITVELKFASATPRIDINSFCEDQDPSWALRFQTILLESGISEELEVEVEDADRGGTSRHNLMNLLLASWKDWRDEDDTVSKGPLSDEDYNPQEDDGAERSWYEERDKQDEIQVENRRIPANGPIKKLEELSYIRGFRDFPAVLTGGRLYPEEDGKDRRAKDLSDEENPLLTGIMDRFKTSGGKKIELNEQTRREDLQTIPGLFADDVEDMRQQEDCAELVDAIIEAIKTLPEDDDDIDTTRTWWPFKDFGDLEKRVEDVGCDVKVPEEVRDYIKWPRETGGAEKSSGESGSSDEGDTFAMKIVGESMGMRYVVEARCIVEGKKVRYIEWNENGEDRNSK